MKYVCVFRLVLRCLLVARKENLTGVSTGLTSRSKNLDPTGNPTGFLLCRALLGKSVNLLKKQKNTLVLAACNFDSSLKLMSCMFVPIFEAISHVTLILEPENRPESLA